MTPRRVEHHPEAVAEARAIFEWYRAKSQPVAERFEVEFQAALRQIEQAPERARRYVFSTHRVVLPHFPYLIVYIVREDVIRIMAVAHGRRRRGYWRHRV